jgi:hypothetical protein
MGKWGMVTGLYSLALSPPVVRPTVASVAPVRVGAVLVLRRAQDAILRQVLRQALRQHPVLRFALPGKRPPGLWDWLIGRGAKRSGGQDAAQDVAQDVLRQAQDGNGRAAPEAAPIGSPWCGPIGAVGDLASCRRCVMLYGRLRD